MKFINISCKISTYAVKKKKSGLSKLQKEHDEKIRVINRFIRYYIILYCIVETMLTDVLAHIFCKSEL